MRYRRSKLLPPKPGVPYTVRDLILRQVNLEDDGVVPVNEIPPFAPSKREKWSETARHVLSAQTFSRIYSFITP